MPKDKNSIHSNSNKQNQYKTQKLEISHTFSLTKVSPVSSSANNAAQTPVGKTRFLNLPEGGAIWIYIEQML